MVFPPILHKRRVAAGDPAQLLSAIVKRMAFLILSRSGWNDKQTV